MLRLDIPLVISKVWKDLYSNRFAAADNYKFYLWPSSLEKITKNPTRTHFPVCVGTDGGLVIVSVWERRVDWNFNHFNHCHMLFLLLTQRWEEHSCWGLSSAWLIHILFFFLSVTFSNTVTGRHESVHT